KLRPICIKSGWQIHEKQPIMPLTRLLTPTSSSTTLLRNAWRRTVTSFLHSTIFRRSIGVIFAQAMSSSRFLQLLDCVPQRPGVVSHAGAVWRWFTNLHFLLRRDGKRYEVLSDWAK